MANRTRLTLGSGLGVLGVAAALFIGVQSGAITAPAVLAGMGTAAPVVVPDPTVDEPRAAPGTSETAVLAGGCFWGVQGVFQHVEGVTMAESGYAGGQQSTADYETVSTGTTGHAESVRITYDPAQVTFGQLLRIYFSVVTDPTQLDRQGPDEGTQYRSAIFAQNATQQRVADAYLAQLSAAKVFDRPIVTKVEPDTGFFPAEQYHQDYLNSHPTSAYIMANDMPKVDALRNLFASEYRAQPVLVGDLG
ncbi:peptide-methionine (S)-S-oxide reductase MsrA [Mycobacterium yunnanensis]|uniref:Peptide methionine sulfoxide reductase MsrA n=1 Tax=Mycobacterium yunnanensis TaxID=368477 RepID=A0A9X2Z439_9MYCO|nr:peptide-methionine (S)-S-oxide reductase MsrA [Mycobacterium yunnanensis]MCV7422229.1 peptide-methionine (S)-S-oxide reductase MsrA [Mycobacterium yunnanensis]